MGRPFSHSYSLLANCWNNGICRSKTVKLYQELAWVWSVLTPPQAYEEEAMLLLTICSEQLQRPVESLLELGCGGGFLASQIPDSVDVELVDSSDKMIDISRQHNPRRVHVLGDMCSVDRQRTFDVVLVHDSVMYLQSFDDLLRLLANAKKHMHAHSVLCIIPDVVKESAQERVLQGSGAKEDTTIVLTEWHWDPDPTDDFILVEFSLLLRKVKNVSSMHESHRMMVLSLEQWSTAFTAAGLQMRLPEVPWTFGGEFFLLSLRQ